MVSNDSIPTVVTSPSQSFRDQVYSLMTSKQVERFWSRVQGCSHGTACSECCWPWTHKKWADKGKRGGYGLLSIGSTRSKHFYVRAHRLAYFFAYGDFAVDLFVCHACDNPPCCNPSHLWLGTAADNQHDAQRKGRLMAGDQHTARTRPEYLARGDKNGAPRGEKHYKAKLTTEQVQLIRELKGQKSSGILARHFAVSDSAILAIWRRKSWKSVS